MDSAAAAAPTNYRRAQRWSDAYKKFGDFRPTGTIWWLAPAGMYFIDYTF